MTTTNKTQTYLLFCFFCFYLFCFFSCFSEQINVGAQAVIAVPRADDWHADQFAAPDSRRPIALCHVADPGQTRGGLVAHARGVVV
jgi:hypothetical protein